MNAAPDPWADLEAQREGLGIARRRIRPESPRDLFVAYDLETRRRRLTYRRSWSNADRLPDLPTTDALACECQIAADGTTIDVSVVLREPHFSQLFVALADSLVEGIIAAPSDDAALTELVTRLSDWQDMLRAIAADGLPASARRGLVGELILLRDDILPVLGPVDAVEGWTGPLRANQDFQFTTTALEVKCTTALNPQGFTVNNERELDDSNIGNSVLSLVHLSLDERRGDGTSLADLVQEIEALLSGTPSARTLFQERLARVGYLDSQADMYRDPLYNVRAVRYFDVSDDFPRIVEQDLRNGVGQVEYRVTLAACSQFEVDRDMIQHRLGVTDGH